MIDVYLLTCYFYRLKFILIEIVQMVEPSINERDEINVEINFFDDKTYAFPSMLVINVAVEIIEANNC